MKPSEPGRSPDPMSREVDRLLQKLRGPSTPTPPRPFATPRVITAGSAPSAIPTRGSVWGRVALATALALGMAFWPYPHACGSALATYLAAVAVLLVAGAWAAHAAWRARSGHAHLLALVIVFAGAAFAAGVVMPRLGYWPVDVTWRCVP